MKFIEFSELLAHIKSKTGRKYVEVGFIYFDRPLDEGRHQKVLVPEPYDWDYLIPYGIYYEVKQGWSDYWIDYLGYYDSDYEPCQIIFRNSDHEEWKLINIKASHSPNRMDFYLTFCLENQRTKEVHEIRSTSDIYNTRETAQYLKKVLSEKKKE